MSSFTIEFDAGDNPERLKGLAIAMTDLRPFWPTAARLARGWIGKQFRTQGAWSGEPWPALSPRYGAWKAMVKPGKPMLVFDGDLRKAVYGPEPTYRPQEMILTITDPVAVFHQGGTVKMPARPPIPNRIPFDAEAELRDAVKDYIDDTLQRWGFA